MPISKEYNPSESEQPLQNEAMVSQNRAGSSQFRTEQKQASSKSRTKKAVERREMVPQGSSKPFPFADNAHERAEQEPEVLQGRSDLKYLKENTRWT